MRGSLLFSSLRKAGCKKTEDQVAFFRPAIFSTEMPFFHGNPSQTCLFRVKFSTWVGKLQVGMSKILLIKRLRTSFSHNLLSSTQNEEVQPQTCSALSSNLLLRLLSFPCLLLLLFLLLCFPCLFSLWLLQPALLDSSPIQSSKTSKTRKKKQLLIQFSAQLPVQPPVPSPPPLLNCSPIQKKQLFTLIHLPLAISPSQIFRCLSRKNQQCRASPPPLLTCRCLSIQTSAKRRRRRSDGTTTRRRRTRRRLKQQLPS
mmetsp:Transcript_6336/g.14955  ORF Transcript_6336/g.14955 Transcript_6336/m.14955 type:complete len:257 (+) Transcript_6336:184-954(+)